MQLENMPRGLGLFGAADDIAVQRGIAEFQAGRPVVIADTDEMIVALPVDGCDDLSKFCGIDSRFWTRLEPDAHENIGVAEECE